MLDLKVEDLDRMIWYPAEIYVDEIEDGWVTSIEIGEEDGLRAWLIIPDKFSNQIWQER